jgi:predicted nucleic-acid-binding protein
MTGIDTNILLHHIVQDDPVQSPKAAEIIERRLTENNPGFVSVVAMAETAWVLQRSYGYSSDAIAAAIERVLEIEVLVVEHEQEVFNALTTLMRGQGSFGDALIAELGASAGCSRTLTFDRKAARLRGFELVS